MLGSDLSARSIGTSKGPVSFRAGEGDQTAELVEIARNIMRARTRAFRVLPRTIFHDDAWDMLLELFIARHEGKTTLVKHLILSAASSTSGMRRVDALEAAELIARRKLGDDHRRVSVTLTERGTTAMTILLKDIADKRDN